MSSKPDSQEKKPYRPPRLVTYGDLRSLTRTSVKGGVKGDGPSSPTKL